MTIDGCPLAIGRGLAPGEAAAALAAFYRNRIDYGNGYEWLTFDGASLSGNPCSFSLCFHQGRLTEIQFGVALPDAKLEDGWPTREAIDEEIEFVRRFFRQAFHRRFTSGEERFNWGTVWSVFDPKGYQASSGIRYG